MPTSVLRPAMMASPMSVSSPASYRPDPVFIHAGSYNAVGNEMAGLGFTTLASFTYPATTRALGFMFTLIEPFLVQKVYWVNGTTATTDNADVAVYTEDGATRLVAAGSTAIATANVVQEKDVTDTLISAGRYWCVYNQSGVTATPVGWNQAASFLRMCGLAQFAGTVALGTTFTPAAIAGTGFPLFGIAGRTQVA